MGVTAQRIRGTGIVPWPKGGGLAHGPVVTQYLSLCGASPQIHRNSARTLRIKDGVVFFAKRSGSARLQRSSPTAASRKRLFEASALARLRAKVSARPNTWYSATADRTGNAGRQVRRWRGHPAFRNLFRSARTSPKPSPRARDLGSLRARSWNCHHSCRQARQLRINFRMTDTQGE